jgi:ABC-type lipoprotein export system ATPase subunit
MLVELARVQKIYDPTSGTVLRDVNFQLAAGEAVAIVGPSGCGKSTLLNLIGALDQPTQGTVRFDGRDLAGLSANELAQIRNREIGFIFQLHHLLPQCTVLENVLIPTLANPAASTPAAARQRAERLLDRVGLKARLHYRPGQLSGGERQRTAVVRALINQPKLLLADEPTGSLDLAGADNLAQLLQELNQEERVALVVVTHSRALAGQMKRVYELRDGVMQNHLPAVS